MFIRQSRLVIISVIAGTSWSCSAEHGLVTEPGSRHTPAVRQATMDEEFRRLAQGDIPGFAGYYLDEAGNLVVLLTSKGRLDSALRVVEQRPMHAALLEDRGIGTREVKYDFEQLSAWLDSLEPTLAEAGVEMVDVDEVGNRLWFGVEATRSSGLPLLTAAINARGIPADAVVIEMVEPTTPRYALQDQAAVLAGGIQIQIGSQPPCTLGFVAIKDGIPGFITASHCSDLRFAHDGSQVFQPSVSGGNSMLGFEWHDPGVWQCAGPLNPPCRYSDATFGWFMFPMAFDIGLLVRTHSAGINTVGSWIQDPAWPYWQIYDKSTSTSTPVGLTLHKVGRTSGWTSGRVARSCVNFPARQLRCQVVSTIRSSHGDSGSPIFHRFATTSFVALHGVLWGGPGLDFDITYHSSIAGIEADMGTLQKVCTPAYSC